MGIILKFETSEKYNYIRSDNRILGYLTRFLNTCQTLLKDCYVILYSILPVNLIKIYINVLTVQKIIIFMIPCNYDDKT